MRILALILLAGTAFAQRGIMALQGTAGSTSIGDDGEAAHLHLGGSFRYYLTDRLSIEPEVQYLYVSSDHSELVLIPNLTYDLSRGRRVVPFLIAGFGLIRYQSPKLFYNNEWYASGGGGARVYIHSGWYVAPEVRIGFEPHVRLTASLGYTFRR